MDTIFEEYEGRIYSVEFNTDRPMRFSPKGKHWPLTTQCVIKRGTLVIGIGEVVKHESDSDNPKYARMYAAKKAFANADVKLWSEIRTKLWKQILNQK